MSKKDKIVEMLKDGSNTEYICTELGVSQSYVYRVKREMDELERDESDPPEAESDNPDDMVINTTGGSGDNVEGNNKNVEEKEGDGKTNTDKRLGGVKKRKKITKKSKKVEKSEPNEQSERTGGVLNWIKKQWKKMLLILTFLILLVIMMLSSSRKESPEMTPNIPANQSRYPTLTH